MLQKLITYACILFFLTPCRLNAMFPILSKGLTASNTAVLCRTYKTSSPINFFIKLREELLEKDINMKLQEESHEYLEELKLFQTKFDNFEKDMNMTLLEEFDNLERFEKTYNDIKKKEAQLDQRWKDAEKKPKISQQKVAVSFCSGLNFETLLNNYKCVAPLRAQLFRLKAFRTARKLVRQKQARNKTLLRTENYKIFEPQSQNLLQITLNLINQNWDKKPKIDAYPPLVYQNCFKGYFRKKTKSVACTSKEAIYFPPKSFTTNSLNSKQKKHITHEICHHALNNISENKDKREFETENLCILVIFSPQELALLTLEETTILTEVAISQRLNELVLNNSKCFPYCFGMINALSQMKNGREVVIDTLKCNFNEESLKNMNSIEKKQYKKRMIESSKNVKNLISEWNKPLDWETAKKLAEKHGFK